MATVDTTATKHREGKTEQDPPYLGVVPSFRNYKRERR